MSVTHINKFQWIGRDDPEDGKLAKRLFHLAGKGNPRAVIGFASDVGVERNKGRIGAAQAPTAIRQAMVNLAAPPMATGFSDLGDVSVIGDALEAAQTQFSITLDKMLRHHDRMVVLGGGHETAFASYSGLKVHYPENRIGIINLDAHLDLRGIGEQGASSGTPFYQMRELDPDQFDYLCLGAALESNTSALFQRAASWDVKIVTDQELNRNPMAGDDQILEMIARNDVIYLTIDLDVLPHYQMPGVSAPATRGVPLATIERIIYLILKQTEAANKTLPLADIVEYCPRFDKDGMGAKTAAYLVRTILFSG